MVLVAKSHPLGRGSPPTALLLTVMMLRRQRRLPRRVSMMSGVDDGMLLIIICAAAGLVVIGCVSALCIVSSKKGKSGKTPALETDTVVLATATVVEPTTIALSVHATPSAFIMPSNDGEKHKSVL